MPTPFRIGFDARLSGLQHAGIGRYAEELLKHWLEQTTFHGRPIEWRVFTSQPSQLEWLDDLSKRSNVQVEVVPIRHYTLAEQTDWLLYLLDQDLDVLYVPHFNIPVGYPRPFVITLHDLLWHSQNDLRATTLSPAMYLVKRALYRVVTRTAAKRAEIVFVPSHAVEAEVRAILGRVKHLEVVPEGVPEVYVQATGIGSPKPSDPFVVYTGSLYPHKNIEVVLQALTLDPKMRLKLIGSRSVFRDEVERRVGELGLGERVAFLGKRSDAEIIETYQSAVAVLQPSKSEGFGLTGLEALACGASLIASDVPVFREVYGEHAQFFDPKSPQELVSAWQSLQSQPPKKSEREAGKTYARGYTWKTMADEMWRHLLENLKG